MGGADVGMVNVALSKSAKQRQAVATTSTHGLNETGDSQSVLSSSP
jgi:hypothetical protein